MGSLARVSWWALTFSWTDGNFSGFESISELNQSYPSVNYSALDCCSVHGFGKTNERLRVRQTAHSNTSGCELNYCEMAQD